MVNYVGHVPRHNYKEIGSAPLFDAIAAIPKLTWLVGARNGTLNILMMVLLCGHLRDAAAGARMVVKLCFCHDLRKNLKNKM